MVGRWVGLSYDGPIVSGWGTIARTEAEVTELHGHYHTVEHVVAVLSTVDTLASHASDADLIRLAAWYHDAVYDPGHDDNEERSAELAEVELARLGLPAASVATVASLVRVTAGHDAPAGDSDAEVLSDADLAVLGALAPAYDSYVAAVRREYSHVDEVGWQAGRGAVLRGPLDRPRLFRTPSGSAWEQPARANLSRELAAQSGPCDDAARRQ